jgi:hypothetical protein
MKALPEAAVDPTVLPFRPRSLGAARFAKFCERFVKVPKGTGARSPLKLRDWQRDCRPATHRAPRPSSSTASGRCPSTKRYSSRTASPTSAHRDQLAPIG